MSSGLIPLALAVLAFLKGLAVKIQIQNNLAFKLKTEKQKSRKAESSVKKALVEKNGLKTLPLARRMYLSSLHSEHLILSNGWEGAVDITGTSTCPIL